MSVGFVGLAHLGVVSSIAAAAKGLDVVAFDPDAGRVEALSQGRLPIAEPGLAGLLTASGSCIRFTGEPSALRGCDVILLAADVPTNERNESELALIHRLLQLTVSCAAPGAVIVILSQVAPGFTNEAEQRIRSTHPERGLAVFYQVETLVMGRAVERAMQPERFIVGCRRPRDPLPAPYADYLERFAAPIIRMRYASAELAKIAINMYLASQVCTTNTLADLCEAIGADWQEIVPALTSDQRIGPYAYLAPGLGFSGGNVERDLVTVTRLAQAHGADARLVEAWLAHSRYRRDWALTTLKRELSGSQDPIIAVWGLAYKPQTASMKNAPAAAFLDALAPVPAQVYDPQLTVEQGRFPHVVTASSALEACRGAAALVVMTPWEEFAQVGLHALQGVMRGRTIVDPYGALDGPLCAQLGFRYRRLGAPREPAVHMAST